MNIYICSFISFISIQPYRPGWQEPEPSHVTGMALAHCILSKSLGVVCHCFPPPLDVPTFAARCLYVRNEYIYIYIFFFFKRSPSFFFREWKRIETEAAKEYCWAIIEAAGVVVLRPVRLRCVGLEYLLYTYVCRWPHAYSVPNCPNFDLRQTFRNWNIPFVWDCLYSLFLYDAILALFWDLALYKTA